MSNTAEYLGVAEKIGRGSSPGTHIFKIIYLGLGLALCVMLLKIILADFLVLKYSYRIPININMLINIFM